MMRHPLCREEVVVAGEEEGEAEEGEEQWVEQEGMGGSR